MATFSLRIAAQNIDQRINDLRDDLATSVVLLERKVIKIADKNVLRPVAVAVQQQARARINVGKTIGNKVFTPLSTRSTRGLLESYAGRKAIGLGLINDQMSNVQKSQVVSRIAKGKGRKILIDTGTLFSQLSNKKNIEIVKDSTKKELTIVIRGTRALAPLNFGAVTKSGRIPPRRIFSIQTKSIRDQIKKAVSNQAAIVLRRELKRASKAK